MEFDIQQSSEYDGFIDDNEAMSFMHDDNFQNFLPIALGVGGVTAFGGKKKARKIDAQTDQIKAQTQALREATDKKMQDIAQQDKDVQDTITKAKNLRDEADKLSQLPPQSLVPQSTPTTTQSPTTQGMSNTMKYGLIGGGVLLVGIIVVMMIKK